MIDKLSVCVLKKSEGLFWYLKGWHVYFNYLKRNPV